MIIKYSILMYKYSMFYSNIAQLLDILPISHYFK